MTELSEAIDRAHCIANQIDPKGNKWAPVHKKGGGLYTVEVVEGNKNTGKPELLRGEFTKPTYAQTAIHKFIVASWDSSDAIAQKLQRKAYKSKVEENSASSTG